MRISDWSSDVCSSDLGFQTRTSLRLGNGGRTLGSRAALSISSGIALGRDVLDSRTDPAISDFQRTANRAEVVVPLALVPDDKQADILARALGEEVPPPVAEPITHDPAALHLDHTRSRAACGGREERTVN